MLRPIIRCSFGLREKDSKCCCGGVWIVGGESSSRTLGGKRGLHKVLRSGAVSRASAGIKKQRCEASQAKIVRLRKHRSRIEVSLCCRHMGGYDCVTG